MRTLPNYTAEQLAIRAGLSDEDKRYIDYAEPGFVPHPTDPDIQFHEASDPNHWYPGLKGDRPGGSVGEAMIEGPPTTTRTARAVEAGTGAGQT